MIYGLCSIWLTFLYNFQNFQSVIRSTTTCTSPLKESGNNLASSPSSPLRTIQRNSFTEGLTSPFSKHQTGSNLSDTVKMNQLGEKNSVKLSVTNETINKPLSILSNKIDHNVRRNSYGQVCQVSITILKVSYTKID